MRELFVAISENEAIKDKIGDICSIDFLSELQPLTSLEYSKLNNTAILAFEETGREQFEGVYSFQYDEVRSEVYKTLNLHVSTEILSEILPKFYKAAVLEPKFTAINSERKMNDIIM